MPAKRDGLLTLALVIFAFIVIREPLTWEINYHDLGAYFVLLPVHVLAIAIVFLWPVACLISVYFRRRRGWLFAVAPFLISVATSLFFTTTYLWLIYNEWTYSPARSEFWNATKSGIIKPTGETMGIQTVSNWRPSKVSMTGGEIFYKSTPAGPLIVFTTFMGIPDGMSGFLYAPHDIDPKAEWPELQLEWADVWDADRHVYFVGNR